MFYWGNEVNGDDGNIVDDILLMQAGLTDIERNCKQINKKILAIFTNFWIQILYFSYNYFQIYNKPLQLRLVLNQS